MQRVRCGPLTNKLPAKGSVGQLWRLPPRRPPRRIGNVMTVTDLLTADHPIVVGVLNVTPDSFFDGGRYADLDAAVAHAVEVRHEGADLVDVGGESTRPGADRVDAGTELRRVLPVIRELAALRVPMSIDTTRATVAAAALEAGVSVVNDVSGGLADPDMARVIASTTGSSQRTWTRSSRLASRSWSGPATSPTWGRCWPARTAPPDRWRGAARPPSPRRCWRSQQVRGGYACTTSATPSTRSGSGRPWRRTGE